MKALHFVFALALPFALLLLMSCKQAHEQRADLGPEFDPDALNQVLGKVVSNAHFEDLQKNQMLHYEESLRVNNSDPNLLESTNDLYVRDVTTDLETKKTRITIFRTLNERTLDGDKFREIKTERTEEFPVPEILSSGLLLSAKTHFTSAALAATPDPTGITYHNLRTSDGWIDPPEKVKKRDNCGNVPNCKIHVTYLAYDEVLWSGDDYSKHSYSFELTSDIPFMDTGLFGIMMSGCVAFSQTLEGKNYYIRDCQALTDLQK